MANFAKLEITVLNTPFPGDVFSFNSSTIGVVNEECAIVSTSFKYSIESVSLNAQAISIANALIRDYGYIFTVSVLGDVVTIEADDYSEEFSDFSFNASYFSTNYTAPVAPTDLEIVNITTSEADGVDKCTKAKYTFEVNNATYPINIQSPVAKVANNAGELFFDYDRFPIPTVTLDIEDAALEIASEPLPTVSTYTFIDDDINVLESFSGATVTLSPQIDNVGDVGLNYTYSLDDVVYFPNNVITGMLPGNYTAYVLDNYGCKKSALFEVIGVAVDKPEPFFAIQDANSFKFFKETTFDYKTTFPSFDNADINSQDIFNTEKRCYKQLVQTNDAPRTQIQTTYETITVNVRRLSDGEIVANPLASEVTTNLNQKDKRDCKIISGATGKTNIYFPGGNIYDPDTLTVSGTYQNPNLLLPSFLDSGTIKSGVAVTLSDNTEVTGDFIVESDVYNTDIMGRALQITATYTGSTEGTNAIVQSLYNALDYNVWEFTVNWGSLPEGDYYIEVIGTDTDPRYDPVTWMSEPINSAERQEGTTYIEYNNNSNFAQMDYSTGIINMLRVPARFALYGGVGEKETFETDSGKVILLKEIIADDITLETSLIPQYLSKKIFIAAAHKDNLTINGLPCAQQEKGEVESLFNEQNRMYKYNGAFRLDSATILTDESGLVSDSGDVLGTGSGNFVLGINL